jgi:hypothetical protein
MPRLYQCVWKPTSKSKAEQLVRAAAPCGNTTKKGRAFQGPALFRFKTPVSEAILPSAASKKQHKKVTAGKSQGMPDERAQRFAPAIRSSIGP